MIAAAKQLASNPDNKTAHSKWQQTNNEVRIYFPTKLLGNCFFLIIKLIDAVGNVREILQPAASNLANGIAQISFNSNSRSCTFSISVFKYKFINFSFEISPSSTTVTI